jgi:hypothetical protein
VILRAFGGPSVDNRAMPRAATADVFQKTFSALRRILKPYEKQLDVVADGGFIQKFQ